MKIKINRWGNSHGIRIPSSLLEHLNVASGEEVDVKITERGIELLKSAPSLEHAKNVVEEAIAGILESTAPVQTVENPYAETDTGYLVVTLNPCKPIIREVPKETLGAYITLVDAKEVARQAIQKAIAEANDSLTELRQLGIDNISYITL